VYRPDAERRAHYYEARLAEQYDVIVHVDTTTAVRPLPAPVAEPAPLEAEPPETYPSGL